MAQVRWTLRGRLLLAPWLAKIKAQANVGTERYGDAVPLSGVRVKVSAKQFASDPSWDSWGESLTDADGRFEIHNVKDQTKRRFKVEAMFKDDTLKIYPPNDSLLKKLVDLASSLVPGTAFTQLAHGVKVDLIEQLIEQTSRITYDVKWQTLFEHDTGNKVEGPVVEFNNLTFAPGAPYDRGDFVARRHAEIWYLVKRAMKLLDDQGLGFRRDRPIAFLHPHDNSALPDGWESSYANPHNDIVYLVQNARNDDFSVSTILHEMMHLWAYQQVRKEEKLASYLLTHFDTHSGRQKHWVVWHEAFAEATSNEISRQLFRENDTVYGGDVAERRPYSRPHLRNQEGILRGSDLQHYEAGWLSAFNLLLCPDVAGLDMNVPGPFAADPTPGVRTRDVRISAPVMDLFDLLRGVANPGGRTDGDFPTSAMGIPAFFAWMDVPEFTQEHQLAYYRILDPEETRQPAELLPSALTPGRIPIDIDRIDRIDPPRPLPPIRPLQPAPAVPAQPKKTIRRSARPSARRAVRRGDQPPST